MNTRSRTGSTSSPCGQQSCRKEVKERGILCARCAKWYHDTCAGLSDESYKVIGQTPGCLWVCPPCLPVAEQTLRQPLVDPEFIRTKIADALKPLHESVQSLNTKTEVKESVQEALGELTLSTAPRTQSDVRLEVRFHGIPEPSGTGMQNLTHGENQLKNVFQFLGESDASISSVSRLGKKVEGRSRPRTLLVKLNTEWSVQKLLTKARNLKQYTSPIFMSRMLSPEDHEKEKLVLKKRRELINQGIPAKELKIENLKLFHNNTEVQL